MEKLLNQFKSLLKTSLCFFIACLLLPVIVLSFICVHYANQLVNYVLSIKYPTLNISTSKKIRTLIDTPRNAGIFHFLLQIKGPCDFERIKSIYAEKLTNRRDKSGHLLFPKLRQKLITCWGHYAWVKDTSAFDVNNHVLLSSRTYRGRPVNDSNIQDFVSDLVTKYIPSDLPQWQVIVIPNSVPGTAAISADGGLDGTEAADHYYILVKVHHLLIAEEEDLHISEMLMLSEAKQGLALKETPRRSSNVTNFVRRPQHIENLFLELRQNIINSWNAFIYEYESLETPDGGRHVPVKNVTQLLSVLLIVMVNVCLAYWHTMHSRKSVRSYMSAEGYWALFTRLTQQELCESNLSWRVGFDAIYHSCHPLSLAKTWFTFICKAQVNYVMLMPYHIYCELMALRELLFKGQTKLTNTYCSCLAIYAPLLIYAQMEFLKFCYDIFKAPVNIYEELVQFTSKESNILQKKSYSGRKIISFSKSIDAAILRERLGFSDQMRESDFTLACLAGALYDYLQTYQETVAVPRLLNTTCRTISKGYLTNNLGNKLDDIGGVVFLQLPLRKPDRTHAEQIHAIVENIRRKQTIIYLFSMAQTKFDLLTSIIPSVLTKIAINYFSHNFPVTLTQIHGDKADFKTAWQQDVEDVLLFRPPQSKTCLSLNIHRFGNKYRLAIMADTQLGPDHSCITQSFEKYMEQLGDFETMTRNIMEPKKADNATSS